jgi:hypothetical protein
VPLKSSAILGFRPHTGWAAAVALAHGNRAPVIVDRRRIVYEPNAQATRFLYHKAAEGPLPKAQALIDAARIAAQASAIHEIQRLIADLEAKNYRPIAAAIPAGNTKLPASLDEILAGHMRIHGAEGAFYRDVLADACKDSGLEVYRTPERDLWSVTARTLRIQDGLLKERIQEMGIAAGPPWNEDQKLATLAAWAHLETPRGRA